MYLVAWCWKSRMLAKVPSPRMISISRGEEADRCIKASEWTRVISTQLLSNMRVSSSTTPLIFARMWERDEFFALSLHT